MNKKKDILFLCQFFYPEYISSATLPYDTALALTEAGFSVDVLCGYPYEYTREGEVPLEETVKGIHIRRVKYSRKDKRRTLGRMMNFFSLTLKIFLRLFTMAKYRTVMVYSNPPILPWVAWCARKLFGCKLIFVAYDLYPEMAIRTGVFSEKGLVSRVMDGINRRVYRDADAVVALSQDMKDYICANRPISPDRVHVIPNWYADKGMIGEKQADNVFTPQVGDRMVVSYFGNMGTAQDMQTILDALRELKDDPGICFLFAGHGNKMEQLQQVLQEEQISNVIFCPFLHGKDFQDALAVSDASLVSLAEGLTGLCVPSKTYSYMMQGIPLLAIMDECDIVSDIGQGAGLWVRNGEGTALAAHIRTLRDDPEGRKAMARCCRALYLEKYTPEICTGKYVTLFQKLITSKNKESY